MPSSKPLPTHLKAARGTLRKGRTNPHEPTPKGEVGKPPDHISAAAKETWRELVKCAPPGVLFNCDRFAVELAACVLAEFRADPSGMLTPRIARLHSQLSSFGMTPAYRTKVVAVEPEPNDPWSEL